MVSSLRGGRVGLNELVLRPGAKAASGRLFSSERDRRRVTQLSRAYDGHRAGTLLVDARDGNATCASPSASPRRVSVSNALPSCARATPFESVDRLRRQGAPPRPSLKALRRREHLRQGARRSLGLRMAMCEPPQLIDAVFTVRRARLVFLWSRMRGAVGRGERATASSSLPWRRSSAPAGKPPTPASRRCCGPAESSSHAGASRCAPARVRRGPTCGSSPTAPRPALHLRPTADARRRRARAMAAGAMGAAMAKKLWCCRPGRTTGRCWRPRPRVAARSR